MKFSILFASLLLSQFAWCQCRITIDKSNTYKYRLLYLIDIPCNGNIKSLYIDNSAGIIPALAFAVARDAIWTKVDTLIIKGGVDLEKYAIKINNKSNDSLTEYIIPRQGSSTKLKTSAGSFEKYKIISPIVKAGPDSLLIYYSEEHGSKCCPRDPIYAIKPTMDEYITQFEITYKVKVGKKYVEHIGEEGENIIYFTLDGLTPEQKLNFIHTRSEQLIPNKEDKKIMAPPLIYMPFLVAKKRLNAYN